MVLLSGPWAGLVLRICGYYIIAGTFILFLFFVARKKPWRFFRKGRWKPHRWGIVVVLCFGSFVHVHEPHLFKIQYDESVLLMTSLLMHEHRQVGVAGRTHYYNGRMNYGSRFVDKRPAFFPFVVSIVHSLSGYRPENAFVVNGLAMFLFLFSLYAWVARVQGPKWGILAVLFMVTLPLLAQNATGAGFDLFNAAWLMLVMNLALAFVRNPSEDNLHLYILSLVILAQCRYESVLFLIPGALVVAAVWWRQQRIWLTWPAAVSPALLISPLLSIRVFTSNELFLQLEDRADSFFDLSNLPGNLELAVYYFFKTDWDQTNSPILSLFGFLSLPFALMLLRRHLKPFFSRPGWHTVFYGFLAVVLFNTLWALTNFWGQFNDPVVSRITLPMQAMLALSIPLVGHEFFKSRPFPNWLFVALSLWIGFYTLPAWSRAYLSYDIVIARTVDWSLDYFEEHSSKRTLIVAESSLPFATHGFPAIPAARAVEEPEKVVRSVELSFYDEVLVLERFKENEEMEMAAMSFPELFDHFEVELLAEERFRPHLASRIFRITGLKEDSPSVEKLKRLRARELPENPDADIDNVLLKLNQLP